MTHSQLRLPFASFGEVNNLWMINWKGFVKEGIVKRERYQQEIDSYYNMKKTGIIQ